MESPKKHPLKFPAYLRRRRRRPLQSHSFSTFIRILSQCQLDIPEQAAAVQGDQLIENNNLTCQGDRSVENKEMMPENGLSHKKSLVNDIRQVVSSQDQGFRGEHMDLDALESRYNVRSNSDQGNVDNINEIKSVVEGNQNGGSDFAAFASLANAFASINNGNDQLLKTDVLGGASKPFDKKEETSSPLERDNTEIQINGRESDTPVSVPVIVSSSIQKTDACIWDGEISVNSGVPDKSNYLLLEDFVSLENNKSIVSKGQVPGGLTSKDGFSRDAIHRTIEKENKSNGQSRSEVNVLSTAIDVQMVTDNLNLAENRFKLVYYGDIIADDPAEGQDCRHAYGRNRQKCGFAEANSQSSCPKILTLSGGSTGENTIENQSSASTEKVTPNNKKRKWGPGSEDRKARRKKNERMKRAEKDRKLGVNRLKLPPVTKPKTIIYCHHFVKGRCHEGVKCKFSHDTVPLMKSKACSHFARQSCMKGNDCSYDHQLSKYPCNNYLSTGSCTRGSNCMFSHDVVPVKEGSAFEQQSISVKETSTLKKPTSKKNGNDRLFCSGISLSKNEEHNGRAEQTPKAISFLSHGKVPSGNMSRNGQVASSPKADNNGAKVDQQRISGASDMVVSLNKNKQSTPAVPPQRGNFLSFGKAPSEMCSSKRSSFSSISNLETRKSPLSDFNRDDGVKVGSQNGRGASSIFQNLDEPANRTPVMTPRGLSFLSAGNHLNSSFNKTLAGSHLNEIDTVQPTDKISGSVKNKVHSPDPVLPRVSSSLSHELSLGKSKSSLNASQRSFLSNTPSSVQKALRSTLNLAAKFGTENNKDHSYVTPAFGTNLNKEASSSENQSTKASTILDLLFGANSKT